MSNRKQGFTLVEILIVVVILGVLAAIVVPKFSDAGDEANVSSLAIQLKAIRGQLELYRIEHDGNYPDLTGGWDYFTEKTDISGDTADEAADASTVIFGPYMQQAPKNNFQNSSTAAAACADGVGWSFNSANGNVTACLAEAKAGELGLDGHAMDYTTY